MEKESTFAVFKAIFAVSAVLAVCLALYFAFSFFDNGSVPAFSDTDIPCGNDTKVKKVIIDAGHGGVDPGAISDSGISEKDLNLEISFMIGEFLQAEGIDVIYTRTEDALLDDNDPNTSRKTGDLVSRVKIAESEPDAVFVSIHMNAIPQKQYGGLQVFYSQNAPENRVLAATVQENVKKYIQPQNTREIKLSGSNIFVLDRIKTCAVLIECGFLSNDAESALLSEKEYQKTLSFVIAKSVAEFVFDRD